MNSGDIWRLACHAVDAYGTWPLSHELAPLVDARGQTRGYLSGNDDEIVVAIAGTKSFRDLLIDGFVVQEHENGGMVHAGFWNEYETIREQILEYAFARPFARIGVCGHSLGGALATYAAEDLGRRKRDVKLLTLGSPRPGSALFCEGVNDAVRDSVRVVHAWDWVPRVPKLDADHVHGLLHLDRDGKHVPDVTTFRGRLLRTAQIALADVTGASTRDHFKAGYLESLSYADLSAFDL